MTPIGVLILFSLTVTIVVIDDSSFFSVYFFLPEASTIDRPTRSMQAVTNSKCMWYYTDYLIRTVQGGHELNNIKSCVYITRMKLGEMSSGTVLATQAISGSLSIDLLKA